jgi:SnoaL-like domain
MHAPAAASTTALPLLRRWVVDYFNRHDDEAARAFISPDYALSIGDVVFAGRDDSWLPAVAEQMRLFPGLGMTVHQTLAGPNWAAAWFSEHGASNGRAAAWSGVAIYFSDGDRLTRCVAQEDYMTRQRQLKSGVADAVDPPAVAPWDVAPLPANPSAEAIVRDWLAQSWPPPETTLRCDDEHITQEPLRFEVRAVEIDALFSSGADVAFHAVQSGTYLGGLSGVEAGAPTRLHANGILRVEDGRVRAGRVIRDRVGLRTALKGGRKP